MVAIGMLSNTAAGYLCSTITMTAQALRGGGGVRSLGLAQTDAKEERVWADTHFLPVPVLFFAHLLSARQTAR